MSRLILRGAKLPARRHLRREAWACHQADQRWLQKLMATWRRRVTIARKCSGRPAVVVFVHHTECAWLRALRPGFRHCFVAIEHGPAWLICDSLKSRMELILLDPPGGFSLGKFYADQGHHVLAGRTTLPGRRTSVALAPLTCVTVAKRLLGVRAPWVWTPWQLFCHLVEAQPCRWRRVSANAPAARLTPSVIEA